jgi:hypothetical protein
MAAAIDQAAIDALRARRDEAGWHPAPDDELARMLELGVGDPAKRAKPRAHIATADVLVRPVLDETATGELLAELRQAVLETIADAVTPAAPVVFVTLDAGEGLKTVARVDRILAIEALPGGGSAVFVDGVDFVVRSALTPEGVLEAMAQATRAAIVPQWSLGADFEVDLAGTVSDRLMLIP